MTTVDYDLGDDAGRLRNHLRELISNHIPADFLGACTENPQDLATTETFCKLLASEGLLALAWPKEHGGGGGSVLLPVPSISMLSRALIGGRSGVNGLESVD